MAILRIRLLGDPVLRKRCTAVKRLTPEDRQLIRDMIETMEDAEGAGLAAPQVGAARRIIVVRDDHERPVAVVNPKIVSRSSEVVTSQEGCLSLPGLVAEVTRPKEVVVRGRKPNGKPETLESTDLMGRALCHEIDHLDGRLYIDVMEPDSLAWIVRRTNKETGEQETTLEPTTVEEAREHFRGLRARRKR